MWKQIGLNGFEPRIIEPQRNGRKTHGDAEAPDGCCVQCFMALEKVCVCRCRGTFHGVGAGLQKLDELFEKSEHEPVEAWGLMGETVLNPQEAKPFLEQIQDFTCRWCDTSLEGQPIRAYPHGGGWTVQGFDKPQWLYIICPKCGYQWALWKLGVKRERI